MVCFSGAMLIYLDSFLSGKDAPGPPVASVLQWLEAPASSVQLGNTRGSCSLIKQGQSSGNVFCFTNSSHVKISWKALTGLFFPLACNPQLAGLPR